MSSTPPPYEPSATQQDENNASAAAAAAATQQQQQQLNTKKDNARETAHNWEAVDGSSMWHDVQEDDDGNILTNNSHLSLAAQIRQRRHRLASTDLARSQKRLVRHMLRHLYLVLDCSRWSREKDPALPPARTRLETTLSLASDFVNEFYDQNPLGHLGVILCRDGESVMLTSLGGSPKKHKLALGAALVTELGKKGGPDVGGEFSLQNGIEVAGRSLGYAPRYGSREIIVIMSALATCDPGDILGETMPRLLHAGIRVSTVALQAEVHICKKLADATGGLAGVCLNTGHLRDLVMAHATPPPVNASENVNNDDGNSQSDAHEVTCEFVEMGFPSREGGDVPTLVHSSGGASKDRNGDGGVAFAINPATADDRRSNRLITFARTGYVCPRCRSRCSDLPSDCAVCGLRLILAPHLARTFHHLFPVRPFEEMDEAEVISSMEHANGKEIESNNGDKVNGKKGLEALPILSSSAFTPLPSISSSNIASFMVSSSTRNIMDAQSGNEHSATPSSKMINIGPSIIANSADCDRCCFGCLKVVGCRPLKTTNKSNEDNRGEEGEAILRFQCPECHNIFCPDCDAFLHETLHNCPGCLTN
mmetsp:Transcript_31184/g.56586  ORF Transcript_31184/g.56586 Transcript_31184/m.56586 type:complete len:594 (+) Transcript_31184:126-1907(+)|eukprot:CAMPEP_0201934152 /NCGR_PEP_ID=MMETSP0903-20130614/33024_1 /ASSEMBLY_ACC=CAM_ASM_000552 /TAXON_ID=420261 /ORGANISM="Thalassiosira antarctica, Strain CCMP982" /LENGTH=593 /DNA_ID=CAMNT_0048474285 /DNA_START=87 /DNA_END=1868 /DNA_ORIENTATION=-